MKKIVLASAAIILSITLASAQTDTTKVVPFTTRKADSTSMRSTPKAVEDPSKDMIKIPNNQIPASLRTTLQGTEYKGWENNGVVYQNPGTSEYAVQISSVGGPNTTAPIWYRFDANGKRITNPNN